MLRRDFNATKNNVSLFIKRIPGGSQIRVGSDNLPKKRFNLYGKRKNENVDKTDGYLSFVV